MNKYLIYSDFAVNAELLLGSYLNEEEGKDVIESAIIEERSIIPRIRQLYVCTLIGRKQPKEIVNILTHEGESSILELKKKAMRMIFFLDTGGVNFLNKCVPKAIVFLSLFRKEKARTPTSEIERALRKRSEYISSKEAGRLRIEVK